MMLKKLTPTDFPDLKRFIQGQPYGLCYYSLPSILTWSNPFYQPFGAVEDDALIVGIEFEEKIDSRHMLLPLSRERIYPPEQLRNVAQSCGFDAYRFVSEEYLASYKREDIEACFSITEQQGYEDYLHLVSDLSELKGNKYAKKRNLINQFRREYVVKDRIRVEPITPGFRDECVDFLYKQSEEAGRDIDGDEDLICEKEAIINHIDHIDILETPGILLRIGEEVAAFGISAHITDDIAALHYEKAYSRVKGLYQYFDNLCAKTLFEGYTYINRESDMGDTGLIRAKNSYHPVKQIRAFELKVKA